MAKPTQNRLKELFGYDGDGALIRTKRTGPTTFVGQRLYGSKKSDGYHTIYFDGKHHYFHRVVFAWHFGYWPNLVDHINRDKSDNRIENLRDASHQESAMNRGIREDNSTGISGVYHNNDGSIVARPTRNGKRIWLGSFESYDKAARAIEEYDRIGLPR